MSEEEKKLVEKFKNLYIKHFNGKLITVDDRLSYIECALITNLIEKLDKELNNLKEIEQAHKTDNGLLRQELDMQIEHNKELEEKLKIAKQIYNDACVCIATDCVEKDKIKEKIEEIINSSARYNVLCKINENEETRRTRYTVAVLKELLEEK